MNISNESAFFKISFFIQGKDPVSSVCRHIRNWKDEEHKVESFSPVKWPLKASRTQWNTLRQSGEVSYCDAVSGNSITIRSACFVPKSHTEDESIDEEYWACEVDELFRSNSNGFPQVDRHWVTNISMLRAKSGSAYRFSLILCYADDVHGEVGEYQQQDGWSVPYLVRMILNDKSLKCTCCHSRTAMHMGDESQQVPMTAVKLSKAEMIRFQENLLDPRRTLPYVYVCSERVAGGEQYTPLLNPDKLAEVLAGNACVFYSTDCAYPAMNELPMEFGLNAGMVLRVYFPHSGLTERRAARHPYITKGLLRKQNGASNIARLLRRAVALVPSEEEADYYFTPDDCRRMEDLHKKDVSIQALDNRARELAQQGISEQEASKLYGEIDNLKSMLARACQQQYQPYVREKQVAALAALADVQMARMPASVPEVIDFFENIYGDRIVFHEDAKKGAKEKSCALRPAEAWEIFFHLAVTMRDCYYKREGNADAISAFNSKVRGKMEAARGEGRTTRSNSDLMRQFVCLYEGCEYDIEPHITIPNKSKGQSVHFAYIPQKNVILVGRCGAHARTAGTLYVH